MNPGRIGALLLLGFWFHGSAGIVLGAGFPGTWPHQISPHTEGSGRAVATTDPRATRVGSRVLNRGGNAFDAAVAVQFALAVTTPGAGNIGGGGFLVLHTEGGTVASLDFRETAPAAASEDMYLDHRGRPTDRSRIGRRAVGVPGTVRGMWELHRRYGRRDWSSLLQPAIDLANGMNVTPELHRSLAHHQSLLRRFRTSRRTFLPEGAPPDVGDTFTQPELARTLERIARRGARGFYRGRVARQIVAEMNRGEGLITLRDLRRYEARWRQPIVFRYRGHRVVSMPPPSSGGVVLAVMAHVLEGYDLGGLPWHSPRMIHLFSETMKRAFRDRNRYLGDPDYVEMPLERLLSERYARSIRRTIEPWRATPSRMLSSPDSSGADPDGHTTHYSIVDSRGRAVSVTTTLNGLYGSGVTVGGAGFLLNNEMDDFTVKPGEPNMYGLVQGSANAIRPGKRMLSSMSPTLVFDQNDRLRGVFGSPGGPTIITTVWHVLSNWIDYDMSAPVSVAAPRFHHQHLPDQLFYEKGGMDRRVVSVLEKMGHHPRPIDRTWGDVNGIWLLNGGRRVAVTDPRQPGGSRAD